MWLASTAEHLNTSQNLRRRRLDTRMRVRPSVIEYIWIKILSMGLTEETMVVPESGVVRSVLAYASENKRNRTALDDMIMQVVRSIPREAGIADLVPP